MLLDGLRSCELLHLQLEDLRFSEANSASSAKATSSGSALPAETIEVLENYLRLERPLTNSLPCSFPSRAASVDVP